ncbi:zinc-binding oxidoreductase [Colletotrichum truncatum]|uniref:Zinc-binding oxidoreductase n=1 Tax=Colletotrichum truncatum TaxID=5467 RepID=A0ACC3YPH5_COLTU|nr:zinc-binding oxidoreductase [Colletotrichum truncatum]XP_036577331.1 zinc-binding oxidoreductase [Colletotrichum truncatum]XP_036586520.1 zinc-binding oxidoreductase [Colletotrichum truncatum]KAF6780541.1 zinc-binding oxidoreductase [Colletotrichum truncatum]KAF6784271.1 zinc-binding oxidoreductase [Colletotrichum truncatum]KAF6796927.1 zinc-binding oxidoreductase [Colletotrichum truncatum]
MSTTMKALVTQGDKTAKVQEIPVPKPGSGEILVKVHYVAQNPTDWKSTAAAKEAGRIVGCDFAGSVADPNGSSLKEGQRVAGWVFGCSTDPPRGAFAEYLVTESSLVFPVPDSITDSQAAVVSLALATTVQALFQRLALPPPTSPASEPFPVLINGGTSSVGLYAVQLAKKAGLQVIATGSKKNHDLLKSLGADIVIDYRDADWIEQVKKAANDNLQYAFDCISEIDTTKAVVQTISSKGGHVMCILPRKADEVNAPSYVKVESTLAYTVFGKALQYGAFDNIDGDRSGDKKFWENYLQVVPKWLEEGYVKPNPPKEFGGLEDIPKGFELQEKGGVSAEKLVYKIAQV